MATYIREDASKRGRGQGRTKGKEIRGKARGTFGTKADMVPAIYNTRDRALNKRARLPRHRYLAHVRTVLVYRVRLHANGGGGGGTLDDERSYMYIYNIIADTDLGGETKNSAPRTCKRGRENRRGIGTKKTANRSKGNGLPALFHDARQPVFFSFSLLFFFSLVDVQTR